MYYDEYVQARAEGWTPGAMRRLLEDHQIAVAEIDGRMSWLPDDRDNPAAADFVEAAVELGARSLTVLEATGRRVGIDIPFEVAAEAFAAVCDRARDSNVLAHIEYFPFSGIPDLATAYGVASLGTNLESLLGAMKLSHSSGTAKAAAAGAAVTTSVATPVATPNDKTRLRG